MDVPIIGPLPKSLVDSPDNLILYAYRGSIAHGMYIEPDDPNSVDDIDLIGIVVAPENCYLGLSQWGSRGTKDFTHGCYDYVFYELRKAVRLLLAGNPNILSLLWLAPEHYLASTAHGKLLIENRHLFVGKYVYNAFAGYAHSQLKRMVSQDPLELQEYLDMDAALKARGIHPNHKGERISYGHRDTPLMPQVAVMSDQKLIQHWRSYQKKGLNLGYMGEKRKRLILKHHYDCKNASHLIRLLRMCVEFLQTGELTVLRTGDRDELLDIKRGKWLLEKIKIHAGELFEQAREAKEKSTLPEQPDRDGAERLVIRILRERLCGV